MGYQCIIVILKNLWMGFSYLSAVSITAIRMHFYFGVGLAHDVHACAAAAASEAAFTVFPVCLMIRALFKGEYSKDTPNYLCHEYCK